MVPHQEPPKTAKISALAVKGVGWSIVQNWGGRLFTFVLFIVLARFLTPTEFGTASAALIVMMLISVVAELGFGDAVVQRRGLEPADVNLPFFASVAVSVTLAAICAWQAPRIGEWLGVSGLQPLVVALCAIAPLTTISQFQEMNYRRALAFRQLAFRVLIANLAGGILAIASAALGAGVWSLVVQTYVACIVGLVWLWHRPVWRPTLELRPRSFMELAHFGGSMLAVRVLDFGATRFFEVVLMSRYGIAVYGLYAAGSRLFQVLMQLLQSALGDVSLTILSRISDDRARMAQIYQQTLVMAGFLFGPVFVGAAALIPEISLVLFGNKWVGIEEVSRPLLLLGAVQSVQFLNGPFLMARGRAATVMVISALKNIAIPIGVLLTDTDDVGTLVVAFALVQLVGTPFSFGIAAGEMRLPWYRLVIDLLPVIIACTGAYFAVAWARPHVAAAIPGPLGSGIVLGIVFCGCYAAIAATTGFSQLRAAWIFLRNRMKSG